MKQNLILEGGDVKSINLRKKYIYDKLFKKAGLSVVKSYQIDYGANYLQSVFWT